MLSIARVFVTFHTAAYLALVGFTPSSNIALATPFPMPMTLKNYSASFPNEAGPRSKTMKTTLKHNSSRSAPDSRSLSSFNTPAVESRQDTLAALMEYVDDAGVHANSLQQSSIACPDNPEAQQQPSTSSLSLFSGSLLNFQNAISDRGLAYFDKNDALEVLLRKIVDEIKYTLNAVDDLVQCDILLREFIGPIVYELKCFLEWLLDMTEDITDASLNEILILERALLGNDLFQNCLLGVCSL
ncbi:hypothetical protein J3R30DRAFT_1462886 [Lentinula aciculospora]|uniref:Uncharacterized protein n=1 Tax=Lentinula aciculospora TaxID=153920 RepID=A0A9W9DTM8_9AGAR|nr:hypothetical protein J3R30DRAFT_1462886 [Lentinula aciculospora]